MKLPQPLIRPAQIADQPEIAMIWRAAWASANPGVEYVEPLEHWRFRLQTEFWSSCQISVAVSNGRNIAFFVLRSEPCVLEQLFVLPSCQSSGVGALLLNDIKRICAEGFSLYVAASNVRAQRFYERHGLHPGPTSVNPQTNRVRLKYTFDPTVPMNAA